MSSLCCCNCQYLYAYFNKSHCNFLSIDIPLDRNHLVYCKQFKLWFGSVD